MWKIIALVSWLRYLKVKPELTYNFGGDEEMTNLEVVKLILEKLGKPESLISFVTDRLGHDRRYAIDSCFAHRELNWKLRHTPREGIAKQSTGICKINRGGKSCSSGRGGT